MNQGKHLTLQDRQNIELMSSTYLSIPVGYTNVQGYRNWVLQSGSQGIICLMERKRLTALIWDQKSSVTDNLGHAAVHLMFILPAE